jgi:hypothetical protein
VTAVEILMPHGPVNAEERISFVAAVRWRDFGMMWLTGQVSGSALRSGDALRHEDRVSLFGLDEEGARDVFGSMSHLHYGRDRVIALYRVRTWYAAGGVIVHRTREKLDQREFPDSEFRGWR